MLWDELREEGVKVGDVDVEMRVATGLVRNAEDKIEGTTEGKVVEDLREYLGIQEVVEELTDAMEMANGVGGLRQVITWDLNVAEEGYEDDGEGEDPRSGGGVDDGDEMED